MAVIKNADLEVELQIVPAHKGKDYRGEVFIYYEIMMLWKNEPLMNPKQGWKLYTYWMMEDPCSFSEFIRLKMLGIKRDYPWYESDNIPHIQVNIKESGNNGFEMQLRSQIPFMQDYMCTEDTGIAFYFTAAKKDWREFIGQLANEEETLKKAIPQQ